MELQDKDTKAVEISAVVVEAVVVEATDRVILTGNLCLTWEVTQELVCILLHIREVRTSKAVLVVASNGNQSIGCVTHLRTHRKGRNE